MNFKTNEKEQTCGESKVFIAKIVLFFYEFSFILSYCEFDCSL